MRAAFALILLAAGASAVLFKDSAQALAHDQDLSLKTRPIAKVIKMLKDMQAELNAEMEDDKAVYEMLTCWCETNSKEKEKAIAEGEAKIEQLYADLGEMGARIKELKGLIATTKDEYNKDWEALNKASAMRMKESKEFHGEETDLIKAIKACEQAIVVLSEQHPGLMQIKKVARGLSQFVKVEMLSQMLKGEQLSTVKAFLQKTERIPEGSAGGAFLTDAIPGMQSYAPQSGQIVGILKQLKEDMEGDISESRKNEMKAKEEFEALKAAKEEEMAAGKKQLDQAETELAEIGEKHAQAMEELADTEEQLGLDKTFLANLEKRCAEEEAEYQERMKGRLAEVAAVQDTIKFLNSDEAFEMFDKSLNIGFVQASGSNAAVQSTEQKMQMRRDRATAVLARAAALSKTPQLGMVLTSVQLDAFTKVKEVIDKMVAELKQQQADEVTQRDWCIAELDKTNLTMEAKYDLQANLMAKIADLEKTIETLTKDIETKKGEIADMQVQMKRASQDREGANADYQQTVMDQRITQTILQKALDRMKEVYALMQKQARSKAPGAPHIQTSATDTDPGSGPARFTKYEKNAGGGRVVAMIGGIIEDSKKLEAEAIAAEQDSQTAYENFMKESNVSITKLSEAITNMESAVAAAKESLTLTKTDLDGTNKELNGLHDTETDLHNSCDYLLKNFFVRQENRAAEIEALGEAKAILSGMK